MDQKWSNSCRLCLLEEGLKCPIFDQEGAQRHIVLKIQTCFPLVIYSSDPLPKMICHKCLINLDTVYEFRQKCLRNNSLLMDQLGKFSHDPSVKQYLEAVEKLRTQTNTAQDIGLEQIQVVDIQSCPPESPRVVCHEPLSCEDSLEPIESVETSRVCHGPGSTSSQATETNSHLENAEPEKDPLEPTPDILEVQIKVEPWLEETTCEAAKEGVKATQNEQLYAKEEGETDNSSVHQTFKHASPATSQAGQQLKQNELPKSSAHDQHLYDQSDSQQSFSDGNESYYSHKDTSTDTLYRCYPCNKIFGTEETFAKHKKHFCPKKNFRCHVCKKAFNTLHLLAKHQLKHFVVLVDLLEKQLWQCPRCYKKFATKGVLMMHLRSHPQMRFKFKKGSKEPALLQAVYHFSCQPCSKHFYRSDHFKNHLRSQKCKIRRSEVGEPVGEAAMPPKAPAFIFECDDCSQTFTRRDHFMSHRRGHRVAASTPKPPVALPNPETEKKYFKFECEICNRKFHRRDRFMGHRRMHRDENMQLLSADLQAEAKECGFNFKCECGKMYMRRDLFLRHRKLHRFEKLRTALTDGGQQQHQQPRSTHCSCKHCGVVCSSLHELTQHMHRDHNRSRVFKCDKCFRVFSLMSSLTNHVKVHRAKPVRCRNCGVVFKSAEMLAVHKQQDHRAKKKLKTVESHKCRICKESCGSRSERLIHQRLHHAEKLELGGRVQTKFTCKVCEETFGTRSELHLHSRLHLVQYTKPGTRSPPTATVISSGTECSSRQQERSESPSHLLPCSFCARTFSEAMELVDHLKTHVTGHAQSPSGTTPMPVCSTCHKTFSSTMALTRHEKIHTSGRHKCFSCETCGKLFFSQSSYNTHLTSHVSKTFHCSRCNKLFFKESALESHLCGIASNNCQHCGLVFASDPSLKPHMCTKVPSSFPCNLCNATFQTRQACNSHMRIHQRSKVLSPSMTSPLLSPTSPSPSVEDQPNLPKAIKTSDGYKCTVCGQISNSPQGAANHARLHNQLAKKFQCPFCARSYSNSQAIYQHIFLNHPDAASI